MLFLTLLFFFFPLVGEANPVAWIQNDNTDQILQAIRPYLPKNPIIIEAGGYNGRDTLKMGQLWPEGRIYTFEPIPELYAEICQQIDQKKFKNIHPFCLALGDKEGMLPFYLSEMKGSIAGSSSLLAPKEHLRYDHLVSFPKIVKVAAKTLDNWAKENGVKKVDFLWLDMQGYELNMLKASQLAESARAIYIEVEFVEAYEHQYLYSDVKKWMTSHGFELVAADFDEKRFTPYQTIDGRYFGNALFCKKQ